MRILVLLISMHIKIHITYFPQKKSQGLTFWAQNILISHIYQSLDYVNACGQQI